MKLAIVCLVCTAVLTGCGLPRGGGYSHWGNIPSRVIGEVHLQWKQIGPRAYQVLAIYGDFQSRRDAAREVIEEVCGSPAEITFDGIVGAGGFHEMTFRCAKPVYHSCERKLSLGP